jgi:hypothetical protein
MRLTVSCPKALRDDANQLAMVLAFSEADALTYGPLNWMDAEGNYYYSAASFLALDEWIQAATLPLSRPEWDTGEIIDMQAATRAQAALVVHLGGDSEDVLHPPQANPDALTVVAGDDGLAALAAMGLVQVPAPDFPDPE